MAASHEFSAPPSVAVTQGDNIQIEYFGDGVVVLTKAAEATDWVHIPITVPKRLNGKNTKLKRVETLFQAGQEYQRRSPEPTRRNYIKRI
jgi:hypothetical protein